ncbi:MAG: TIGR00300 family protein [Planctomycetaceae bacterium]|nr:MAG: TIGR00300 family protein [Planctomycetaceae bacterium]
MVAADYDHREEVEMQGHIIDSLLLPKVLDLITSLGGDYETREVRLGHHRHDPSYARLEVRAPTRELLEKILSEIGQHGAVPVAAHDCHAVAADIPGTFPEGFYVTTNEPTEVRWEGRWLRVGRQEMDCGIKIDPSGPHAECIPMADVRLGDLIVVGRLGVRVLPVGRDIAQPHYFGFMNSAVSSEKPKHVLAREIAELMRKAQRGEGRNLVVAGPAVVHTGSRELMSWLIRKGFVQVLFAGNALAAHDIEQSFYGTSLGISMEHGGSSEEGHEHHLRAINRIRRVGSIRAAVEQSLLTQGIMYECVTRGVPYVLAGSIRDDGPLPDVITDTLQAQAQMRALVQGVTFCLMIATTLHSIAVGNLLPAWVKVVCVDINPATVTKLTDRGTFQTIGIVTDVEPFLRVLVQELGGP